MSGLVGGQAGGASCPTATTDPQIPAPGASVTSVNSQVGAVTVAAGDAGLKVKQGGGVITLDQVLADETAAGTVVWYAIDGVNGVDATGASSIVSQAAAALTAWKTFAGFARSFPRIGNGQKPVIAIAAGTYAGGLDVFLLGTIGYANDFPLIVGTVTNATASSVAFAGDANDRIMAGFVTATGMNVTGYNPVAAFSQSAMKCLAVGGGAPGFPSETAAPVPMGWRIRFDVATTTAALRNFATPIIGIAASDTLTLVQPVTTGGGLPAVPVGTDVFYIEMAGVNVGATRLQTDGRAGLAVSDTGLPQVVGVQFGGSSEVGSPFRLIGCSGSFQVRARLDTPFVLFDETGTQRIVGCGLRATGTLFFFYTLDTPNPNNANACIVAAGNVSWNCSLIFSMSNGSYIAGGVTLDNIKGDVSIDPANAQLLTQFGGRTANNQSAVRIRGTIAGPVAGNAALWVLASDVTFQRVDISGLGAFPCIKVLGLSRFCVSDGLTSLSGGNTDVGMDMTNAQGCTIFIARTPTITGNLGDVRLPDGTIQSWANLALGFVDSAGNRYIGLGALNVPTVPTTFSGALLGGAAQVTAYLANAGIIGAVNQTTLFQWPSSNRVALRLRGNMLANNATGTVTATLLKNGVATAQQISWGAGVTGTALDRTHPIVFSETDTYDIQVQNAGADVGKVSSLSVALEWVS